MKMITSSIAGAIAGLALAAGGMGAALAQGQDPEWIEEQPEMQDESLIEGVEQQELSGSFDQNTSDDWFFDTYEIEGQQQQTFGEEPTEPILEDEPLYDDEEGLFDL